MLEGTKKLFPTEYEKFKAAMISAANDDELPVSLKLEDISSFTLKDFQDAFTDIEFETGLKASASMELNPITGKLELIMCVDHSDSLKKPHLQ